MKISVTEMLNHILQKSMIFFNIYTLPNFGEKLGNGKKLFQLTYLRIHTVHPWL